MGITKERIVIEGDDRTRTMFNSVRNNTRELQRGFGALKSSILAVAGPAVLGMFISRITEADDRMAKMASNLGLSTEALSEYEFAAKLSGIATENLFTAIRRLQKNVSDAEKGLTTAKRAFDDLNLDVQELIRLAPEEQFERTVLALGRLENQSERTRVAQDLFGRSGVEILKLVKDGAEGLNQMTLEARMLGVTLSGDVAEATEEWNDSLTRVKAALVGTGRQIAALRNQELTDMINDFAFAIPAAVFATGRMLDEFMLRINTFSETLRSEYGELGIFGRAFILTPPGALKLASDTVNTYKENLDKVLPVFEKETEEKLDKIFDRVFTPRKSRGPQPFSGGVDLGKIAGVPKGSEDIEIITRYWTEHSKGLDVATEQWRSLENHVVQFGGEIAVVKQETDKLNSIGEELGLTFESMFENAVIKGESFRDVLQGVFQDIQRIILRKTVTEPIGEFVGGLIDSIDFGFGGGKAFGGPVAAGVPYLVGERGPEIFTPSSSGQITANNKIGGVTVHFHQSIDARNSDISETKLKAAAKMGAEQGYQKVFNDFVINGPLRKQIF